MPRLPTGSILSHNSKEIPLTQQLFNGRIVAVGDSDIYYWCSQRLCRQSGNEFETTLIPQNNRLPRAKSLLELPL